MNESLNQSINQSINTTVSFDPLPNDPIFLGSSRRLSKRLAHQFSSVPRNVFHSFWQLSKVQEFVF